MTIVDGCAVGVVLISTIIGCVRGLTREVLALCAWLGAIASTWMCWPLARHLFEGWIANPMLAGGATIIALFVLFLILFSLISYFLSNLIRHSWMGGVDRSLGSLFGVIRGASILCVLELVLSTFLIRAYHPEWLKKAHCAPLVYQGSDIIYSLLPSSIHQILVEQRSKLQPVIQNNTTVSAFSASAALQAGVSNIEQMARLEPKRMLVQEGYSKKQRQDMERFLSQDPISGEELPKEIELTPSSGD